MFNNTINSYDYKNALEILTDKSLYYNHGRVLKSLMLVFKIYFLEKPKVFRFGCIVWHINPSGLFNARSFSL